MPERSGLDRWPDRRRLAWHVIAHLGPRLPDVLTARRHHGRWRLLPHLPNVHQHQFRPILARRKSRIRQAQLFRPARDHFGLIQLSGGNRIAGLSDQLNGFLSRSHAGRRSRGRSIGIARRVRPSRHG